MLLKQQPQHGNGSDLIPRSRLRAGGRGEGTEGQRGRRDRGDTHTGDGGRKEDGAREKQCARSHGTGIFAGCPHAELAIKRYSDTKCSCPSMP